MVDISDLVMHIRQDPARPGAYLATNYAKHDGAYIKTTISVEHKELVRLGVLRDERGGPVYYKKPRGKTNGDLQDRRDGPR